jgi:hypothetical protein
MWSFLLLSLLGGVCARFCLARLLHVVELDVELHLLVVAPVALVELADVIAVGREDRAGALVEQVDVIAVGREELVDVIAVGREDRLMS